MRVKSQYHKDKIWNIYITERVGNNYLQWSKQLYFLEKYDQSLYSHINIFNIHILP